MNRKLFILPPVVSGTPNLELVYPADGTVVTKGSSIRLEALASDPEGGLQGVQFYVDKVSLATWSGLLDFNNTLPPDNSTLTFDDGTGKTPTTFYFDTDQNLPGGGIPDVIPGSGNQLSDLTLSGDFSGVSDNLTFLVEIDGKGTGNNPDTFRWSMDGGITYVQEKTTLVAGASVPLRYGLSMSFGAASGHGLGDNWTFSPANTRRVIPVFQQGGTAVNLIRLRNTLYQELYEAMSFDLLALRPRLVDDYNLIYLDHLLDQALTSDVSISGTSLSTEGGTIELNSNDLNNDGNPDNFIRPFHPDATIDQPFGITWEANVTGNAIIYAIVEDLAGNRVTSSATLITVEESVGQVPTIKLGATDSVLNYSGSPVSLSLTAEASDPDGEVAEVTFYANGVPRSSDTSSPFEGSFEINATGLYELYAVARDNSGNIVTSNTRSLIVNDASEVVEESFALTSPSSTYLGGVASVSSTYLSSNGIYDSGTTAYVYVMVLMQERPRSYLPGTCSWGGGPWDNLLLRSICPQYQWVRSGNGGGQWQ